jgi:hypothetical protein
MLVVSPGCNSSRSLRRLLACLLSCCTAPNCNTARLTASLSLSLSAEQDSGKGKTGAKRQRSGSNKEEDVSLPESGSEVEESSSVNKTIMEFGKDIVD